MSESTTALLQTVREGLQALAEELAAGKSERLRAVLDFASRFHRYSPSNQLLIASACPQASYVAGYRAWQNMGYQVRQGERGIRILAPRPYTRTTDDGEEEQHLGFAAVAVFDAGQLTQTTALPTQRSALPDDQQARCAAVLAAVQAEGIRVEERDDLGSAEGYSAGGVIALRRGLDSHNRALVLLHEYVSWSWRSGAGGHPRPEEQGRSGDHRAICHCQTLAGRIVSSLRRPLVLKVRTHGRTNRCTRPQHAAPDSPRARPCWRPLCGGLRR